MGFTWQAFLADTNVEKIRVIIGQAKIYWSMRFPEMFEVQTTDPGVAEIKFTLNPQ